MEGVLDQGLKKRQSMEKEEGGKERPNGKVWGEI